MIPPSSFIELLRCPQCVPPAPLILKENGEGLHCSSGQHHFPFTEGFPDLRPDDLKAPAPAAQNKAQDK
ncbi:hypothetical protein [Armatimonas sp.]|uniref:hypothetical protein n=1 Tax=Armatimonas sp. TaxID=1872638 RepID=UPI00286B9D7A|nr:hypothetical protein [Armatimonas sp.]